MKLSTNKLKGILTDLATGWISDRTDWELETAAKDFQEVAGKLQAIVKQRDKERGVSQT